VLLQARQFLAETISDPNKAPTTVVTATLRDEVDLRHLTRVDEIVADLKQAKNLRILVLDACRDNPLAEELSRSMEASRSLSIAD
jgi:hypothetical protein